MMVFLPLALAALTALAFVFYALWLMARKKGGR